MTVQEQLYEKLQREYNDFLQKLRGMQVEQIIEAAYEKVIKEEILTIFADKGLLPDKTAEALLDKNINMEDFYSIWKDSDWEIRETINEFCATIVHEADQDYKEERQLNPAIMPDYAITKAAMERFGYNDNSMMLPLTGQRAAELYKQGLVVFKLFPDATETEAMSIEDLEEHKESYGIFGIENGDWLKSKEYLELSAQVSGYEGMIPLRHDEVHDLYMKGHDVYLLFNGGKEERVYDSSQLDGHKGFFGLKREDWLKIEENEKYPDIDQHNPGQYAARRMQSADEMPKHPETLMEEQPTPAHKPPIMPDSSITITEMRDYGYIYERDNPYEILPLNAKRAMELFNQDCEVFLLHDDNGESAADSIEEIKEHSENGGIFGIEYDVWLKSKEYQTLTAQAKAAEKEWKTYKAELSVPGEEHTRMEIILADDDEDAINQAYECVDMPEMFLTELHELDENNNIIRDVNLLADHSLRRFADVDLIDFLGKIADKVITHYPQDFKQDIEILWKKALLENPAEQKLMWHCSAYGTHLLNEDEVLTKDTGAYGYWVDYRPNEPSMMGYVVEVTGYSDANVDGRETVLGNVYEVGDYAQHAAYVKQAALPLDSVSLSYSDNWGINAGKTVTVPRHEYDRDRHRLMSESGNVTGIKYHPSEIQMTMAERLRSEQRKRMCMQIGSTDEHLQKIDKKLAIIRGVSERIQEVDAVTNHGVVNEIKTNSISHSQDAPAETPKSKIPVYKDYLDVAAQKGEKPLFAASQNLNRECSQAIDRAISENSRSGPMAGTQYVNATQALNDVISEYGAERVAWVLAGNVLAAGSDGRISRDNRDWAGAYNIPKDSVYDYYLSNIHLIIVDNLVKSFRKIEQERAMPEKAPSSKEAEKDNAVGNKQSIIPKKPKRGEDR